MHKLQPILKDFNQNNHYNLLQAIYTAFKLLKKNLINIHLTT